MKETFTIEDVCWLMQGLLEDLFREMESDWHVQEVKAAEGMFCAKVCRGNELRVAVETPEEEPVEKVYHGLIRIGTYSQDEGGVVFVDESPIADDVRSDILCHGSLLSVSYYISDEFVDEDTLQTEFLKRMDGDTTARYAVCYSDYTGYLYTEQELNVGGHNLIEELTSYEGKYVYLKIAYTQAPL